VATVLTKEKIMDDVGKYLERMTPYEFWKLVRKHRQWLTPKEAAACLGIKPRTLESWRAQGKGPTSVKSGKFVRYHIGVLDAWITTNIQPNGGANGHPVPAAD